MTTRSEKPPAGAEVVIGVLFDKSVPFRARIEMRRPVSLRRSPSGGSVIPAATGTVTVSLELAVRLRASCRATCGEGLGMRVSGFGVRVWGSGPSGSNL